MGTAAFGGGVQMSIPFLFRIVSHDDTGYAINPAHLGAIGVGRTTSAARFTYALEYLALPVSIGRNLRSGLIGPLALNVRGRPASFDP